MQVGNNMRKSILFLLSHFMSPHPKAEPVNRGVAIGSGIHNKKSQSISLNVLTLMAHKASIYHLHLPIGSREAEHKAD